ncbi:MAG: hypothetical protein ABJA78_04665 [Ferruginibacter sp.]
MKLIKLLSLTIALFLFSHCGYSQLGNLSNKVKNTVVNKVKSKSGKTETTADKDTQTDKAADPTVTTVDTKENNNVKAKTMSNESNTINKKYFLYEDLKIISGATFHFSDKPFGDNHEGAKTNFKSSEFVYGRLELNNQSIEDAFKLSPLGDNYYLIYNFSVVNGDEGSYAQSTYNSIMLKPGDIKKSAFNFDLLPDPAKASTGIGMNYQYGFDDKHISGGPMYLIIDQSKFPNNGDYTIQLQFYFRPVDGWGNGLPNSSDWPGVEGAFKFNFNTADVTSIKNNFTKVDKNVRAVISTLHAMPNWWPKTSRKLPDASLNPAALEAMIKAELSSSGDELVKFAVGNNSPNTTWVIQKNDLGVPTYQLLAENVYTIYKREGKCFIGDVSIAMEYLGGGKYGKPYVRNVNVATSGYGTAIDCSAIK